MVHYSLFSRGLKTTCRGVRECVPSGLCRCWSVGVSVGSCRDGRFCFTQARSPYITGVLYGCNKDTSVVGVSRCIFDGVTSSNGIQSCRVWGRLCLYSIVSRVEAFH